MAAEFKSADLNAAPEALGAPAKDATEVCFLLDPGTPPSYLTASAKSAICACYDPEALGAPAKDPTDVSFSLDPGTPPLLSDSNCNECWDNLFAARLRSLECDSADGLSVGDITGIAMQMLGAHT